METLISLVLFFQKPVTIEPPIHTIKIEMVKEKTPMYLDYIEEDTKVC